jgi:hypothetical protein
MICDLLDRVVSDSKETIDKIMEFAPFIVIGGLWLLGAIAKTVQASKKSEQTQTLPYKKPVKKRQPENLADFIRIVKEQYASTKQQAMKTAETSSVSKQPSAWPKPRVVAKPPLIEFTTPAEQPVFEKTPVKEPPPVLEPVSLTPSELAETKVEHPAEMAPVSEIHETRPHPYLAELTRQFTDADGLRKAVLYSEILGRPVALRSE